jgi:hypothetical protein
MHRSEASHRPAVTSNLHGSSWHHFSTSNADPIVVPESAAHLSAPTIPQAAITVVEGGGAACSGALNKANDNPVESNTKAITPRRIWCLRDARATCEGVQEDHVQSLIGKMEAGAGNMSDQCLRAACLPPSIRSFSSTSSSQFQATFRSHSFGYERNVHGALSGATGMEAPAGCELENSLTGIEVGCELDGSNRSSNLSLHYLITRARRGKTPPSANASPITDGNISCGNGRRLVKLDLGEVQELNKAVAELTRWGKLDEAPGKEPDSLVEVAVGMAFTPCTVTGNEEPRSGTDASSVATPRLKRRSACSYERSNESTVSMTPIDKHTQNKSRRLLSDAADSGRNSVASSVDNVAPWRRVLSLPDPSTTDRRTLFAMSRLMCSRSSIESFGNCSHAASDPADCSPPCPSPSRSTERGESSDGGLDGRAVGSRHRDDVNSCTLPSTGAPALSHADDVKSITEDAGRNLSHISWDEDDDAASASTSGASAQALCCLQGSPRLSTSSPICRDWREEDSVAFSMDSVHMRKKQLNDSQHTDWAVGPMHYANDNGRNSRQTRPFQQIEYEIDMDAIKDDSILHRSFQREPTGSDDDEQSFVSVSSLSTKLSERVYFAGQYLEDMTL